jgi:hypothetical protein
MFIIKLKCISNNCALHTLGLNTDSTKIAYINDPTPNDLSTYDGKLREQKWFLNYALDNIDTMVGYIMNIELMISNREGLYEHLKEFIKNELEKCIIDSST